MFINQQENIMYLKEATKHIKQARYLQVLLNQTLLDMENAPDADSLFSMCNERDCLQVQIGQHVNYARECLYTPKLSVFDITDLPF